MKSPSFSFKPLLLAAALLLPAAAMADDHGPRCDQHARDDARHHSAGHGFMGEPGPRPPFLRGIELTDSQSDAVFSILHERAPSLRSQFKALGQARRELRELTRSEGYDEAKARALGGRIAEGTAALALMRAQDEHRIWALLTPAQRQQVGRTENDDDMRPVHGERFRHAPDKRSM